MYQLYFLSSAKKEFKKLDFVVQKLLKEKLILLCENPNKLKNNIKALKGNHKNKFRLRVNQYRILFQLQDDKLIITIVSVGHRKDIY